MASAAPRVVAPRGWLHAGHSTEVRPTEGLQIFFYTDVRLMLMDLYRVKGQ